MGTSGRHTVGPVYRGTKDRTDWKVHLHLSAGALGVSSERLTAGLDPGPGAGSEEEERTSCLGSWHCWGQIRS